MLFSLDEHGVRDKCDAAASASNTASEPTMHVKTVNDGHCHFLSNRFFEALGAGEGTGARPVPASDVATELGDGRRPARPNRSPTAGSPNSIATTCRAPP